MRGGWMSDSPYHTSGDVFLVEGGFTSPALEE